MVRGSDFFEIPQALEKISEWDQCLGSALGLWGKTKKEVFLLGET